MLAVLVMGGGGVGAALLLKRRATGWNTLDLFDVSGTARLHQVPILTTDVERRAITGWFY